MNKEQAIQYIWDAAAQGRTPGQIAAEISQVLGAPVELTTKFVDQVLASARPNQSPDAQLAGSETIATPVIQDAQAETAELDELILQALLKQKNHSDLVMLVCERTGLSWDQAEKKIEQVLAANQKKVVGWESLVFIPVSVISTVAGFFLIWASAEEMYLSILVLLKLAPPDPLLSTTLQDAPLLFWVGFGLFLGGGIGLYKALQNHFQA